MSTRRYGITRRVVHGVLALALVGSVSATTGVSPASAASYVPVTGAGSTWSQVAVDAWRADIRAQGVVINYSGTGSTDGRLQYIQKTVDFSNTEIPFQNPPEPGQLPEIPARPYAYLPIVAGGTAFMYNLKVGGKLVRDLKLSSDTLAKIFTGKITRWSDPQIARDNGRTLPNKAIVPVLRSDGAGASAQFTRYMSKQNRDVWCPFFQEKFNQPASRCGLTSFYPSFGNAKLQVGSNGVANYVSAKYGEGAIGYVEYAYAKRLNFPVASLLNKGGYYAQPTAGNVAVALTAAKINSDLTQNLDAVYANPDKRTYPLSSYSYMVAPTTTASPFNEDKGRSLSKFVNYFLCAGQKKADILGYSPLPKNLVQAGFDQVKRIPGHEDPPSFSSCSNPALRILTTAPQPNPCNKAGAKVSCSGVAVTTGSASGGTGSKTGGSSGTTSGTTADGSVSGGAVDPTTGEPVGPVGTSGGTVDPATGQVVEAAGVPIVVAATRNAATQTRVLYWLSALELLAIVVAPPLIIWWYRRRRAVPV